MAREAKPVEVRKIGTRSYVGDNEYRQRSLEAARATAQKYADKFQTDVGIFVNDEGTALHREMKLMPTGVKAVEVIKPSQPDLPVCPTCSKRMGKRSKVCKNCEKHNKR
jgi:hypothetical protein